MTKTLLIGITAITLFSGCAQQKFVHPTNPQSKIEQDKKECMYEGKKAAAGQYSVVAAAVYEVEIAMACMDARGYSRIAVN